MKELRLAYSPCPNDTFIFDAWVNKRIESEFRVSVSLMDVEQLNRLAAQSVPDITKVSIAAYPAISEHYQLLDAGSALGFGCGPLLVSKQGAPVDASRMPLVAIPGLRTTANLLLSLFYPHWNRKKEYLFSVIEAAVLDGSADLGLLIHESRFTYAERGLVKLADLGERWEERYGVPLPLGGIAIRRSLPESDKKAVNQLLRNSVDYAFRHPQASRAYVQQYASEMSAEVQQQHISLYVNKYSFDLGVEGHDAIQHLFAEGVRLGLLPECKQPVFLNQDV